MKYFLPFLFISTLVSLHAEEKAKLKIDDKTLIAAVEQVPNTAGPQNEDLVDPRVLRDFIESRGLIACRQKCGKLTLAGDARARYAIAGESVNGQKKRGSGTRTAANRYKSEFNLFIDYVDPKSWVSTKVKWNADMGVETGIVTKIGLDRAFLGFELYECKELDFYIEAGRSRLEYIFDSRVEFSSFFDGIHLYYTNEWPRVGTFVAHGGPFVIDAFTNHYGWALETYIDEWMGTGLILKYSIIDWRKHGTTRYYGGLKKDNLKNNARYRFLVSQMLFGYASDIDFFKCKTLYLYAAVLTNHDAKKSPTTANTYANKAWYAGFTLGKLCKACDWSLDANYQYVQAQAVPEFDLAGIGHGNAEDVFFSDALIDGVSPGKARGFTNFKGIQVSLLYALTDALSLRTKAEWTRPINKKLGGDFNYKAFEMAAIYAF